MMRRLFVCLFALLLSGCVVVPLIDGVNQMGLSQGDRERLLPKEVKKFHDDLYWGEAVRALQYVKESERADQGKIIAKDLEGVRVVDSKVDRIEFIDGAHLADVYTTIRQYKVPYYVVQDIKQKQRWEFNVSDGWKFVSKTVVNMPN